MNLAKGSELECEFSTTFFFNNATFESMIKVERFINGT